MKQLSELKKQGTRGNEIKQIDIVEYLPQIIENSNNVSWLIKKLLKLLTSQMVQRTMISK